MIEIKLTVRQTKQLRKHLAVVNACYLMGDKGMLVGQIRQYFGEETACAQVGFVPGNHSKKLTHLGSPQIPNGWAGIPAVGKSGDAP